MIEEKIRTLTKGISYRFSEKPGVMEVNGADLEEYVHLVRELIAEWRPGGAWYWDRAETSKARVSFTVPGLVPSKSNFRLRGKKKSGPEWNRIKEYEEQVGLAAMAAGAKKMLRSNGKARLTVTVVNQAIDLDNALKSPIDGLKQVAVEDDSPKFVKEVRVLWREDAESPEPRTEFEIEWDGGAS